jgi:hypothetical protein
MQKTAPNLTNYIEIWRGFQNKTSLNIIITYTVFPPRSGVLGLKTHYPDRNLETLCQFLTGCPP